MAGKTFELEVITPERLVFSEEVDSIQALAGEGWLGVLANHAPIVSDLMVSVLKYRQGGNLEMLAIGGGFLEVHFNKAIMLVETAEKPEEIDIERAQAAKERAEKRLFDKKEDIDVARAECALQRALTRLKAAGIKS